MLNDFSVSFFQIIFGRGSFGSLEEEYLEEEGQVCSVTFLLYFFDGYNRAPYSSEMSRLVPFISTVKECFRNI